jgi:hypothetical protein
MGPWDRLTHEERRGDEGPAFPTLAGAWTPPTRTGLDFVTAKALPIGRRSLTYQDEGRRPVQCASPSTTLGPLI